MLISRADNLKKTNFWDVICWLFNYSIYPLFSVCQQQGLLYQCLWCPQDSLLGCLIFYLSPLINQKYCTRYHTNADNNQLSLQLTLLQTLSIFYTILIDIDICMTRNISNIILGREGVTLRLNHYYKLCTLIFFSLYHTCLKLNPTIQPSLSLKPLAFVPATSPH